MIAVDLPPDHPVQVWSDQIHQVLAEQTPLGLDPDFAARPTVAVAPSPMHAQLGVHTDYARQTDRILIGEEATGTVSRAAELSAVGRIGWAHNDVVGAMVHEHLHGLGSSRAVAAWGSPEAVALDEGAVEAVTADLEPVVLAATSPGSPGAGTAPSYGCVARLRTASVVGSAARRWTDRAAHLWRLRLAMAHHPERVRMLAATGTGPEVCS